MGQTRPNLMASLFGRGRRRAFGGRMSQVRPPPPRTFGATLTFEFR
jgi:hypothetical protein